MLNAKKLKTILWGFPQQCMLGEKLCWVILHYWGRTAEWLHYRSPSEAQTDEPHTSSIGLCLSVWLYSKISYMIIPLEMFQVFFCFLAVTHSLKHTQSTLSSSPPLEQAHLQLQWSAIDATFFLQALLARQWRAHRQNLLMKSMRPMQWLLHKTKGLLVHPSTNLPLYSDKESIVARWMSVRKSIM